MIAGLLLGCTPAPPPPAALVVVVDRLRADELGAYGNLPTDTPRIDALARRGTRYVRAYAPATSVGPSRTSLMQGQLPPQHGHREDVDYPATYGRWVSETGWAPCEIYLSVSDIDKGTFELDKCVSKESELVVVWVERSEAVPLSELDQMVGSIVSSWDEARPESLGAFVGLVGSVSGLRYDGSILLTDDLLRVPLMVWGPGQPTDWQIDKVMSTADLGSILAHKAGANVEGVPLPSGRAYHESTVGYSLFGARPLTGFTRADGRYVEGVYGRWYPAQGETVRPYEDPQSEYPELAQDLSLIRAGIGEGKGLPPGTWRSGIDPADRVSAAVLVMKLRAALKKGRLEAANRIFGRLEKEVPAAPVLEQLRQEMRAHSK